MSSKDRFRGCVTIITFSGRRSLVTCADQSTKCENPHRDPHVAAHCAQQMVRRMTPNSKDKASESNVLVVSAWVGRVVPEVPGSVVDYATEVGFRR